MLGPRFIGDKTIVGATAVEMWLLSCPNPQNTEKEVYDTLQTSDNKAYLHYLKHMHCTKVRCQQRWGGHVGNIFFLIK